MTSTKPKPRTRATRFIWQAYDRMKAAGIDVDCDSAYRTVCISKAGEDDIFMQGDDANSFIDEARAMWKRYPSLPKYVCEMAIAEPYTDLWI